MNHRRDRRTALKLLAAAPVGLVASAALFQDALASTPRAATRVQAKVGPVEPGAGGWKTWFLQSGSQLRLQPPPDSAAEVAEVRAMAARRDAATMERIEYWDAGSAAYRWNEIALDLCNVKNNYTVSVAGRVLALMNGAIYDGAIAAWDSKYTHNRPRPSEVDPSLTTAVTPPASPSYPSEHAVAAGAASAVLAHLFPSEADSLMRMAEEAATSRVIAGVQYPSDTSAGLEIGRTVAAMVIERARNDNFGAKWEGTIPNEPGKWTGPVAVNADESLWLPWVLTSPSQIRPGPPPAADSPQMAADLAEVKNFPRTPRTTGIALSWQFVESGGPNFHIFWNRYSSRLLFEEGQPGNLPRAAQVYFLTNVAIVDTWIATQEAKFTYWGARPNQLDPTITTVFPTPPHPSYVSNRSSFNPAAAAMLGHFFPRDAATMKAIADEISESAIWAGIHFRTDIVVAQSMGDQVVQMVKARAF